MSYVLQETGEYERKNKPNIPFVHYFVKQTLIFNEVSNNLDEAKEFATAGGARLFRNRHHLGTRFRAVKKANIKP